MDRHGSRSHLRHEQHRRTLVARALTLPHRTRRRAGLPLRRKRACVGDAAFDPRLELALGPHAFGVDS